MKIHHHTLVQSFGFAMNGIKSATKYNRNIRIHFIIAVFVIIFSFVLNLDLSEKAIIIMIILLVISAEMINTALEEIVNLVTKDYREEAKIAKDVSAGMVFIVAIGSIAVGLLIFIPHLIELFVDWNFF